jgi:DMSO/TMAO reductase YedYZ molybdopterin-dependent catalytic subunit
MQANAMKQFSSPALERLVARRRFIRLAGAGTAVAALGGFEWVLSDELTRAARAETRGDGKPRLPPGQRVLERLRPMGGEEGDPSPGAFRLAVRGLVESPFEVDFRELLTLPQVTEECDVHCVTGWSVLGASFTGVRVAELARRAKVKPEARHVVFEAAHGYTTNVRLAEALRDEVLVAHRLEGKALPRAHGAPVRGLVPSLYFWKSAKWLTGIRFVARDEPGYWETRGYHNHADPWKEERYG